jgi:creatinine amidohydrolase
MKGVLLENLNWLRAEQALNSRSIAVLPVGGASKEHGPHLPYCTDFLLAEEFKRRIVERAPVVMLPTLSYAYYPAFLDWAGSISIGPETFAHTVMDIVRSLARHGVRKYLIINTGVSTRAPLEYAARELTEELGVRIALTRELAQKAWEGMREERSGGHAGEYETSMILAIRPDMVDMSLAVQETPEGLASRPGITVAGKILKQPGGPGTYAPNGVNGDATKASAEKGRRLWDAAEKEIMDFLAEFLEAE